MQLLALKELYTETLQLAGNEALLKLSAELASMNDEKEMMAHIGMYSSNVNSVLKSALDEIDNQYKEFLKDPESVEEATQYVADMMGITKEEVKQLTVDAGKKSDDDDPTKH